MTAWTAHRLCRACCWRCGGSRNAPASRSVSSPCSISNEPAMNQAARALRIQLLIAFMCVAMLVYFVLLGRLAIAMIASGRAAAVGLGLAVLLMPVIGLWAMIATLRAGFAHQKLARLIAQDGMELDTSALPRRPSGRIEREAADALFATVRTEVEGDPDDWRRWYRLARAYDYAGDRRRAREAIKTAVQLQGSQ